MPVIASDKDDEERKNSKTNVVYKSNLVWYFVFQICLWNCTKAVLELSGDCKVLRDKTGEAVPNSSALAEEVYMRNI